MAKLLKVIELLAQSEKSWEDAAKAAVNEASQTLRNIRSIYIKDFKAVVEGAKITQYRGNGKVSFDLDRLELTKRVSGKSKQGLAAVSDAFQRAPL